METVELIKLTLNINKDYLSLTNIPNLSLDPIANQSYHTRVIFFNLNFMKPRVGINGFGRIGRCVLRSNLAYNLIDIVAVNDICPVDLSAHLIKYDSNYGILSENIVLKNNDIQIDEKLIKGFIERDIEKIPWKEANVDLVMECTGLFTDRESASKHLRDGVKKVIISAPAKSGIDKTIVLGTNEEMYDPSSHHIISNASCTTNCLAPITKVLHKTFGIKKGLMTTIHSYTQDQRLHDSPHKDYRRARSATLSMIPTSTGAAKAIGEVLPDLKGKMHGISIRVPTPTVSLVDLVCELEKDVTKEEVNNALKVSSENELKGILGYTEEPLVSIDFKKDPRSGIVDGSETVVIEGNMVKILAWYDNEWAYSTRMVELAAFLGNKM